MIPILGWFKLLPTFGGCVVTAAKTTMTPESVLEMEVDYTTSKPVKGLQGLGEWIWSVKVPVGAVWKLLPWKGRPAACSVALKTSTRTSAWWRTSTGSSSSTRAPLWQGPEQR